MLLSVGGRLGEGGEGSDQRDCQQRHEEGKVTRNTHIQSSYLYSKGFYKILKKMVENVAGLMSDVMDIKVQLDEMRRPW